MPSVFADTWYWIALVDIRDEGHGRALGLEKELRDQRIKVYTSEMILSEVLNFFSNRKSHVRGLAVKLVEGLRSDRNVNIIPQDSELFESGFRLYQQRPDKAYSHTDCSSMRLMTVHEIRDAVTEDHHFAQEGYTLYLSTLG